MLRRVRNGKKGIGYNEETTHTHVPVRNPCCVCVCVCVCVQRYKVVGENVESECIEQSTEKEPIERL